MKYRILVCANAYPPNFIGGAELIAHFHAKVLQRLGHEPVIFAGDPSDGSARYAMRKEVFDGLPVYRVHLGPDDYNRARVNFFHPEVERHFLHVLRDVEPHVVHFHNIIGLSLGLIRIAAAEGIGTIMTVHDHWGFCLKSTLLKTEDHLCVQPRTCGECLPFVDDGHRPGIPVRMRLDFFELSLQYIDTFVSPSRYLAESYIGEGFEREKFHVVWNGIDTERFRGISRSPSEVVRFTFIGYLGSHKGVHVLINALRFLERERGRFRVNIVGDGVEAKRLRDQVAQSGLERTVHFWGKVGNEQVEKVYEDTDVFVLPSVTPENQPVTITEALTAGIPVIGSRLGGIPELIHDGETGYLFEPGNPEDLARKMREFINAPDRAAIYGETARERSRSNTFDRAVEKIIELYGQLATHRPNAGHGEGKGDAIIVCEGRRMSAACAEALVGFSGEEVDDIHRFVMSDWLDGVPLKRTALLWIVDTDFRRPWIARALEIGIPLLVPEAVSSLKNFCLSANCGLYYKDRWTAEACLEFLLRNKNAAREVGRNGQRAMSRLGEFGLMT